MCTIWEERDKTLLCLPTLMDLSASPSSAPTHPSIHLSFLSRGIIMSSDRICCKIGTLFGFVEKEAPEVWGECPHAGSCQLIKVHKHTNFHLSLRKAERRNCAMYQLKFKKFQKQVCQSTAKEAKSLEHRKCLETKRGKISWIQNVSNGFYCFYCF